MSVNDLKSCTRKWFGWANAMLVALVEGAMGIDCSVASERTRLARVLVGMRLGHAAACISGLEKHACMRQRAGHAWTVLFNSTPL